MVRVLIFHPFPGGYMVCPLARPLDFDKVKGSQFANLSQLSLSPRLGSSAPSIWRFGTSEKYDIWRQLAIQLNCARVAEICSTNFKLIIFTLL